MNTSYHYQYLKSKWANKKDALNKKLWNSHGKALSWASQNSKQLMVGSFGSLLMLAVPVNPLLSTRTVMPEHVARDIDPGLSLSTAIKEKVPEEVRELTSQEESEIGRLLSHKFGIQVAAELDGKRLNRSYGYIGAEQHLMRYPGDTMDTHFDTDEEARAFYSSGMAPGKGAWGYFSPSLEQMTEKDKLREKYYIAVQTFLAPDFLNRVGEYRDFFKYRKMLVVNPQNGRAVVTVIGDAGPAAWTGKHLGGSPEVMKYLERVDGRQRGPVLYFFIDDPNDTVQLGPIIPL